MNFLITYITFLVFTFISTSNLQAQETEKDAKNYLATIKAKSVDEQILGAEFAQNCASQTGVSSSDNGLSFANSSQKQKYEECISKFIDNISNENIKKVGEKMNLAAFDKKAAASATSIKEYLQNRLHSALYGKDINEEKLSELTTKNIIDHEVFYQLYSEQIGKNSILQISRYCLEHFGGKSPELMYIPGNTASFKKLVSEEKTPGKFDEINPLTEVISTLVSNYESKSVPTAIWRNKEVREYSVCTLPNKSDCDNKYGSNKYRHTNLITALKNAEFQTAQTNSNDPKIIRDRYAYCAVSIIPNMCNLYKCNNVYSNSSSQEVISMCKNTFNISVKTRSQSGIDLSNTDNNGAIACNVQNRLKEYKRVLLEVKEIQAQLKNGQSSKTQIVELQNKLRQKGLGADQINIGEITTISSKEISEGVDEFINGEDTALELEKVCMREDPDSGELTLRPDAHENPTCEPVIANLDKGEFDNIQLAQEANSAIKVKEIESMNTKKELDEFLSRNNLSEYVDDNKDLNQEDLDNLKDKVAQEFKAKQMALVASLQERFKAEAKLDKNSTDQDVVSKLESEIAMQSISDVKEYKNRVETLIQYSNVVSSYLEFKGESEGTQSSESLGRNVVGLNAEVDNVKENNEYVRYFSSESSSSGYGDVNYLQFIDQVIGNTKEEASP